MVVNAENHLGTQTVLEYLISPIPGVTHEARRERQKFRRVDSLKGRPDPVLRIDRCRRDSSLELFHYLIHKA
jgi:hypothetical protein